MATIGSGQLIEWAKNGQIEEAAVNLYQAVADKDLDWLPEEVQQLFAMAAANVYKDRVIKAVNALKKDSMMFSAKQDDDAKKKNYNASEVVKSLHKIEENPDYQKLGEVFDWFIKGHNSGTFQQIKDCVVGYLSASIKGYSDEEQASSSEGKAKLKHQLNLAWKELVGEWFAESIKNLDKKVRDASSQGRPLFIPVELNAGSVVYQAGDAYYPKKSLFKTLQETTQFHEWQNDDEADDLLDETDEVDSGEKEKSNE